MNANELRIGNLVYKSLKSGQGRTVINPIGCQDIVRIFEDIGSFNYAPIPITEDILLKCGGLPNNIFNTPDLTIIVNPNIGIGWYKSGNVNLITIVSSEGEPIQETRVNLDIQYLHQLQNLFFCLCGKELTIKL